MSNTKKWLLIIASLAVVAGLVIGCAAMAAVTSSYSGGQGFSDMLNGLNTAEYVSNTYTTEEPFENIEINGAQSDIRFVLSDELTTSRVECKETASITHTVEVVDNTLVIRLEDNSTWREHIGINFESITATVYLPQKYFGGLTVDNASGDIDIPKDFCFNEVQLNTASGDITFLAEVGAGADDGISLTAESASGDIILETRTIIERLSVNTASGDISISNTSADSVKVTTSSGRIETYSLTAGRYDHDMNFAGGKAIFSSASGDIRLSASEFGECVIDTSSGEVRLDGVDAETYDIETASGDVEGHIRSNKNFITSTASGDIDVPYSHPDAGECRISTSSGDIDIDVVF